MQTVRKDCLPEETILRIKNLLLDKLNLSVQESHICNNTKMHSVRLEISNIPLGTNGKGTSPTYALASAYGEFMERLQAGFLIEPWIGDYYINKKDDKIIYNISDIENFLRGNFSDICSDITLSDIESFSTIKDNLFYYESIYDVFNSQITMLPVNIISALCGSNGLCAGNTPYEAICQGIGELFERYVVKELISSRFIPLKIKEELYNQLPAYNLIKYIEEKGYICDVYNCTLNGKLPVIGVVILNHSKTKKVFALGADINFDIAIQRCLTEVLQGKILNLAFQSTMTDLITLDIIDKNWKEINSRLIGYQMQKHFLKGNGNVPLGFLFNNNFSTPDFLNIFKSQEQTNKELFDNYLQIIKLNNWKIYVKDYSYLGFPTYRVFIPNSSSLYNNFDQYLKINLLKKSLKNELEKDDFQYEKISNLLSNININSDFNSFISLNEILHILNPKNNKSSHLLELILLYVQMEFEDLHKKYLLYNKNNENNFLSLFLFALANGDSIDEVKKAFQIYDSNCSQVDDFLRLCNNIQECFYTCKNCNNCSENPHCYTPSLITLYQQLLIYKERYIEDYKF